MQLHRTLRLAHVGLQRSEPVTKQKVTGYISKTSEASRREEPVFVNMGMKKVKIPSE